MVDQTKVDLIQKFCTPLIGRRITRFESVERRWSEDAEWHFDSGMPIRIYMDHSEMVAISWSKFDDLWLANDHSLPYSFIEPKRIRWVENSLPWMNACLGRTIHRILLGKEQMSWDGRAFDIWTRLIIDLGERALEVYNDLDQNGFELHPACTEPDFVVCAPIP